MRLITVVIVVIAGAANARAETSLVEPAADPLVEELVRAALAVRPELRAAEARTRAERELLSGCHHDEEAPHELGRWRTEWSVDREACPRARSLHESLPMQAWNVPGQFIQRSSGWRQMASATWGRPNDPTIYGTLDLDVTAALAYARRLSEHTRKRVTLTPVVVAALARTLARHPDCNSYIRLGRMYQRENVDIFVLVAVPPQTGHGTQADLSGVKVDHADQKSVLEIANELERRVTEVREGRDPALAQVKRVFRLLPPSLTKLGLKAAEFLQYELNLDLSAVGIPRDSFGSAFVTNVGAIGPGVGHAFPPIVPMTRLCINVAMGAVEDRPVADRGAVVVRPVLPVTATFDHRVIDGFQGAKLSRTFCEILQHPEDALAQT